ncbi:hypothetical protein ACVWW4_000352 [Bradyrhizobium sp. LB7.1]
MTTAKPPAGYGAVGGARPSCFALPSYTTSGETTLASSICGSGHAADLKGRQQDRSGSCEGFSALPREAAGMTNCYFDIHEASYLIRDREGIELPGIKSAR